MAFKKSRQGADLISLDSIQALFDQINAEGWQINNLFQIAGCWRANARREINHANCEFCDGATATEALYGLLHDIRQPRNQPNHVISPEAAFRWELSLQNLVNETRYQR